MLERLVAAAPKGIKVQDTKGECDRKKVPEKHHTVKSTYEHYRHTDESVEVKRAGVCA